MNTCVFMLGGGDHEDLEASLPASVQTELPQPHRLSTVSNASTTSVVCHRQQ